MKCVPSLKATCLLVTVIALAGASISQANTHAIANSANAASVALRTTHAPALPAAAKATIAHVPTAANGLAPVHTAAANHTAATTTVAAPAKVEVKAAAHPVAPAVAHKAAPSVAAPVVAAVTVSPAVKLGHYFDPICTQLEKLQARHMFKIQSQLKSFIEKTNGKMSLCFMQQYGIDPNLTPVSKPQLQSVCTSRSTDQKLKGSFKQFTDCATHNWDSKLDAELERIARARANCAKKHEHSKTDPTASLAHDEDEIAFINDVVNKVLDTNKGNNKADIKVIDLTFKPHAAVVDASSTPTAAPVKPGVAAVVASVALGASPKSAVAPVGAATTAPVAAVGKAAVAAPVPTAVHVTTQAPAVVATKPASHIPEVAAATKTVAHAPVIAAAKVTTQAPAAAVKADKADVKPGHAPVVATDAPAKASVTSRAIVTSHPTAPTVIDAGNLPSRKILNDPNTLLVLVDDSGKGTTAVPAHKKAEVAAKGHPALAATSLTSKLATAVSAPVKTTARPASSLAAKIVAATTKPKASASASTTVVKEPVVAIVAATTPKPEAVIVSKSTVVATKAPVKVVAAQVTTAQPLTQAKASAKVVSVKPTAKLVATTKAPIKKVASITKKAVVNGVTSSEANTKVTVSVDIAQSKGGASTTTVKPVSTEKPKGSLKEKILKQKKEVEKKIEGEKDKAVKGSKKQEEKVRNAIKSLQNQRAASHGGPTDARLHQLEHERQMAIDPIGHTIKHQQYEASKLKKKAVAAAAAAKAKVGTSTTKKPAQQ